VRSIDSLSDRYYDIDIEIDEFPRELLRLIFLSNRPVFDSIPAPPEPGLDLDILAPQVAEITECALESKKSTGHPRA
jgi:hypothetical protein